MLQIDGLTVKQKRICNLLWKADTPEECNGIIEEYGTDASTMQLMILFAVIDENNTSEVTQAQSVLEKFQL